MEGIKIKGPELRQFSYSDAKKIVQDYSDLKETIIASIKDEQEIANHLKISHRALRRIPNYGTRKYLVDAHLKNLIELVKTNPEFFHGC